MIHAAAAPCPLPATMTPPTQSFRLWGAETLTGGAFGAPAAHIAPLALVGEPVFHVPPVPLCTVLLVPCNVLLVPYTVFIVLYTVLLVPSTVLLVPSTVLLVPSTVLLVPSTVLLAWYGAISYTALLLASHYLYRSVIFCLLERLISNLRIISL